MGYRKLYWGYVIMKEDKPMSKEETELSMKLMKAIEYRSLGFIPCGLSFHELMGILSK